MGRTYDKPGSCRKCGSSEAIVQWEPSPYDTLSSDRSDGFMMARCRRCWYEWRVTALDEMPTVDDAMLAESNRLAEK